MALVRMELARILIRELNDYQIIELREVAPVEDGEDLEGHAAEGGKSSGGAGAAKLFSQVENGRSFPIVIGLPEAQAIERRLKGIVIKRPQTHDLLMNIIAGLGGKLESITINDLQDHTFFALLSIRTPDNKLVKIDSRPSDAIALGIASNVPIFVDEKVLDAAEKDEE
ncbi:MAG TPA: bifunctional nuclease family protein [Phycisphaerales bacterium]|jgi:bifunctional DNase/RNase|nr:bifunctional nuclease family protein [Phycisphaerales bacterium]